MQNNDKTIKLTVKSGLQKPYLYKSKAYKRNDTAKIEVDALELSRLILEGKNIGFEELPCEDQEMIEDEYLSGKLSVLRNRNLANVFYRLGFVEIWLPQSHWL